MKKSFTPIAKFPKLDLKKIRLKAINQQCKKSEFLSEPCPYSAFNKIYDNHSVQTVPRICLVSMNKYVSSA
jgi:hypothetical protein